MHLIVLALIFFRLSSMPHQSIRVNYKHFIVFYQLLITFATKSEYEQIICANYHFLLVNNDSYSRGKGIL